MKPNFALSLSFEGIRLLHRSGTGWTMVGEVALDSPDLTGELAVLRKTALALDPAGLRSKIILPNDQIRYLALDTTRATADEVRATLQGATPYKVDDLAWDFARGGGRTYIAAVARETLDEAEGFAAEHRFGPVSFVAIPDEFAFVGEPFFGQTRAAGTLLPQGETVERDAVPIKITPTARSTRPRPATTAAEPASPDAPAISAPAPATASVAAPDAAPPPDVIPAPVPETARREIGETPVDPASAFAAGPTADTASDAEIAALDAAPGQPVMQPAVPPTDAQEPSAQAAPDPAATATPPVTDATGATTAGESRSDTTAPTATPEAPATTGATAPLLLDTHPAADEPTPVFSSRTRPQRALVANPDVPPLAAPASPNRAEPVFTRRTPPPVSVPPPLPPVSAPPVPPPVRAAETVTPPSAGPTPATQSPAERPSATVASSSPGRISIDTVAAPTPRAVPETAAPRITGVTLGPTVVPFAPPRAAPATAPITPDASARIAPFPQRPKAEAVDTPKRATPPGAAPARGKPRFLGLILTAILVVLMLIAALWLGRTDNVVSRLFRGDSTVTDVAAAVPVAVPLALPDGAANAPPDPTEDDTTLAASAPPLADDGAAAELAPLSTEDATDGELIPADPATATQTTIDPPDAVAAAAAAAFVAEALGNLDTQTETATDTAAETPPSPAPGGETALVTAEEADRFYAATGVWLRAPRLPVEPETEDLTTLALSAMDASPAARDGASLPAAAPDAAIVAQINPPPPGTRLPRDDRGFILATPEGTVSPDGLVIFAGTPAVVPPTRPGTVAPETPPVPDDATAATDPAVPDQPLAAPPSVRPLARTATFLASLPPEVLAASAPETAVPDAATDTADPDTALPGGVTLAGLRPPARPGSIAALAPEPLPAFTGTRPPARPVGLAPEGATSLPADALPADAPTDIEEPVDPEAALAQTLASIVEGAGDPLATATTRAVAVARRPDSRPSNFARVVQQQTERLARATAAVQEQTAQQQTAPASLGTPEESVETEAEDVAVAAAAPSGTVPRTVSEAATMENAMALREINLIGVYGTPNDRRALVRLDNGRYVRVTVGDSLDGGQVSAISDNALNYVRRGRTITLEIPDG